MDIIESTRQHHNSQLYTLAEQHSATRMAAFSHSQFFTSTMDNHSKATVNKDKSIAKKKARNAFLTYSNKKMRDFLQLSKKKPSAVIVQQQQPQRRSSTRLMSHKIKSFTSTGSTASSYSSSSSSTSASSVCSMEAVSFKSKLKRKLFVKSSMKLLANNNSTKRQQLERNVIIDTSSSNMNDNNDLSYNCNNNSLLFASQEDSQADCCLQAQRITIDQTTQIEKEDLGKIIANIYKMMDKSLGWLKSKSTSKSAKKATITATTTSVGHFAHDSQDNELSCNTSNEQSYHTYSNSLSQNNNENSPPLLITAPSMASSFDMSKLAVHKHHYHHNEHRSFSDDERQKQEIGPLMSHCHSTPRSLLQQVVSPIFSPHDQRQRSASSLLLDNISSTTKKSTSITSRARRLSFGVTSSPKSSTSSCSSSSSSTDPMGGIPLTKNLNSTFYCTATRKDDNKQAIANAVAATTDYSVDSRFLNHIDNVKRRSIRLAQQQMPVSATGMSMHSGEYDGHFGADLFESCSVNGGGQVSSVTGAKTTKRRKLQQIFQIKLKKQLRELRKWHVGMRGEFDLNEQEDDCDGYDENDEDDRYVQHRRHMHSSRIVQPAPLPPPQYRPVQHSQAFAGHPSTCVCYSCFLAFRALMQNTNEIKNNASSYQQMTSRGGQFCASSQTSVPFNSSVQQSNRYLIQNNNVYNQYCTNYRPRQPHAVRHKTSESCDCAGAYGKYNCSNKHYP